MSHLTMEQLLALREPGVEPGTAWARAHLGECAACRAELERLHQRVARLRALPALRPARDGWPGVRARLAAERRRRLWSRAGLAGLAAAASVALAVAGYDLGAPAPLEASAQEISAARERSQALEQALDRFDPEARVVDGRTAAVAQALEERIADVDRRLQLVELERLEAEAMQADEERLQLWRERVGLLDALVDVHVTRASSVGM